MKTLVVDAGTSSVRIMVFDLDGATILEEQFPLVPTTPFPGLVEFDASELAAVVLKACRHAIKQVDGVDHVAVTNQRASTVVWDRKSGEPVAPALGWQDLRTIGRCLELRSENFRTAPNATATKAEAILDAVDPERSRDLCIGTVDSWIVWSLSEGNSHITDATNAGVTTLRTLDGTAWDNRVLKLLRISEEQLPRVVDSAGELALASALPGSPVLTAILGDQQASLVGQGCVANGLAKITFGTGAMLDIALESERPYSETLSPHGTFPIIALQIDGEITWGLEAMMLSAGTNIEWLRDDLGIIDSAEHSADVANECDTTDGVQYVPALLGLGTPDWDYGARGSLLGLTRGTNRSHVVRAVLEGIAQRAVDLITAIEADSEFTLDVLRVDGGMTANTVFIQALANATQRPVAVSPEREATALGAALLAQFGAGHRRSLDEIAGHWQPERTVEPNGALDREQWELALERSRGWHGALSAIEF